MALKKSIGVWILGFLTFLAAINVIYAVLLWKLDGPYMYTDPYIIGNWIGDIQISTYFWISATATFIFLGLTSIVAFRRVPPDPAIVRMLVKLGGHLAGTRKMVETAQKDLNDGLANNRMAYQHLFKKANEDLENTREEMLSALGKQKKTMEKVQRDALSKIKAGLDGVRKEMLGRLDRQAKAIQTVTRVSRRNTEIVGKQGQSLAEMRSNLEGLEVNLQPPKATLTSRNELEEINGVGSGLGKELRSLGLTNVGELIATDPATIAEKTRPSRETVERLQQKALLLMVPGIEENDVRLLKEVGVSSRGDLADQDPLVLSRRLEEAARTYVELGKISNDEKPTIEEVASWVKNARF